jgi:hypothetical protein
MTAEYDLEQVRNLWRQEPEDSAVLRAATDEIDEYPPEIQGIILEEAKVRGLLSDKAIVLTRKTDRTEPSTSGEGLQILITIIFCFLVGVIGNGLLFAFYETYDYIRFGGEHRLVELKEGIDRKELVVKKLESNLQINIQKLKGLTTRIENLPDNSGTKIALMQEYAIVDSDYQHDQDKYTHEYEDYEKMINLYNDSVSKQISRWYLIHIPIRMSGR